MASRSSTNEDAEGRESHGSALIDLLAATALEEEQALEIGVGDGRSGGLLDRVRKFDSYRAI
jgi:hypothetical protein